MAGRYLSVRSRSLDPVCPSMGPATHSQQCILLEIAITSGLREYLVTVHKEGSGAPLFVSETRWAGR